MGVRDSPLKALDNDPRIVNDGVIVETTAGRRRGAIANDGVAKRRLVRMA